MEILLLQVGGHNSRSKSFFVFLNSLGCRSVLDCVSDLVNLLSGKIAGGGISHLAWYEGRAARARIFGFGVLALLKKIEQTFRPNQCPHP